MNALDAIKDRLKRATPGPWFTAPSDGCTEGSSCRSIWAHHPYPHRMMNCVLEEDAEFIAHSRTDIERLVRAVEILREGCKIGHWDSHREKAMRDADAILEGSK